jgi:putative nucleotidyltransferase with HDIG domain
LSDLPATRSARRRDKPKRGVVAAIQPALELPDPLLEPLTLLRQEPAFASYVPNRRVRKGGVTTAIKRACESLLSQLRTHHPATADHCLRVGTLAKALAERLDLSPLDVERCRLSGILHDVGKLAVRRELLDAPRSLEPHEWDEMQAHARATRVLLLRQPPLAPFADDAGLHHERADGSGYPFNLRAAQIPTVTKVITVADIFDAVIHARPYHVADPVPIALQTIEEGAGRWWCERSVVALRAHVTETLQNSRLTVLSVSL